jgi:hypothetical protein
VKSAREKNLLNAGDLQIFASHPMLSQRPVIEWDIAVLLNLMWETWNSVFRQILEAAERG